MLVVILTIAFSLCCAGQDITSSPSTTMEMTGNPENNPTTPVASDATQAASDATMAASDATQAISDATQAASDATQAATDATQAASDATQAASDATQAASDATQPATDATQAASDATQAASDATPASSEATPNSTRGSTPLAADTSPSSDTTSQGTTVASTTEGGDTSTSTEKATTLNPRERDLARCRSQTPNTEFVFRRPNSCRLNCMGTIARRNRRRQRLLRIMTLEDGAQCSSGGECLRGSCVSTADMDLCRSRLNTPITRLARRGSCLLQCNNRRVARNEGGSCGRFRTCVRGRCRRSFRG